MMRRAIGTAGAALVLASAAALTLRAQSPPAPPPQGPTFRAGVDVIQLDVTVLDKNRRPIHGLTAADFVVLEDGKPQRIVAVAAVNEETRGPAPTARMRHVMRDVASNDLVDEVGDGRAFAVLIDDSRLPLDSVDIAIATREAAHYVIGQLGPFDRAAVVYPVDSGRSQDFTSDIMKLGQAIDAYDPHLRLIQPPARASQAWVGGGDRLPYLSREPECARQAPVVPALDALVTRLANIPQRRKTLVFISLGGPSNLKGGMGCAGVIAETMKDLFRKAERGNVNIHPIDPTGVTGYQDYLRDAAIRRPSRGGGAPPARGFDPGRTGRGELARRDTLQLMADYTGGRAVVATDAILPAIDQIFDEDSSYYLVGYQTANPKTDGSFRRVEVKVTRPGAMTHTQSGYWAPRKDAVVVRNEERAVSTNVGTSSYSRSMLEQPSGLSLRATIATVARTANGKDMDIAALLTVRLPPLTRPVTETVSVIRTVYDAEGRPGPPAEQRRTLALQPPTGGEVVYDLPLQLSLPPGRYQLRFHAHSRTADRNGSVFVDLEVPDVSRLPLSLSGIVLGTPADTPVSGDALLPLVPTTRREFTSSERVQAFLRIFQGERAPRSAVTVRTELIDASDKTAFEQKTTLGPESFDATGSAEHLVDLPVEALIHGPYLLTVTAQTATGQPVRQDVLVRVK